MTLAGCFLSSDSPDDALSRFADALERRDAQAAAAATDDPDAARPVMTSMFDGLGKKATVTTDPGLVDDKKVTGTIAYRWSFGPDKTASYQTDVALTEGDSGWRVRWSPTVLHRNLLATQSFSYSDERDVTTNVVDRSGRPLMTWQTVSVIALRRDALDSADQLARALRPVEPSLTAAGIRESFRGNTSRQGTDPGADGAETRTVIRLREDDMARVGRAVRGIAGVTVTEQGALLSATRQLHSPAMSGLEEMWRQEIDRTAGWSMRIVNADGAPADVLGGADARPTPPVRTTLDRDVQTQAQRAVDSQRRPAMIVALRPSTGGIVAVAQNAAADRSGAVALTGLYPPGSTFKTITTAAALDADAVQPRSPVQCPGRATIEGRTIPNEDDFDLGTTDLTTAFARSCNTTMGALANRLPPDALTTTARAFGIGADYTVPGVTTVTGRVPNADTPALRVENGIGQGTVTVSPFGLALAEASLARGQTVTPQLVVGRDTTGDTEPQRISPTTARALRAMMAQTVASGTATELRDIPGLGGKTGTAEYGDNRNPHGWFAGIVDDLSFATLVVGGGSSGPAIAVTGEFLRPLRE
ncbi:penicillin-binding transpeptidase domain-containing protein [Gordonia sinesedis]